MSPLLLGVNIDHVATLRQARYAQDSEAAHAEPVLLDLAREAQAGGADSLTLHLREDRRHIQDADVKLIRAEVDLPFNLEMGNAPEILEIALQLKPDFVCLVPEKREEVTTEGGLDVTAQQQELQKSITALQKNNSKISLFIDPDLAQVEAAAELGAEMIELHTGSFANLRGAERQSEVQRLISAAELANKHGIQVNAGHGLTTKNLPDLFAVPHLVELNIGHHLISRALTIGLRASVAEMKALMAEYPSS